MTKAIEKNIKSAAAREDWLNHAVVMMRNEIFGLTAHKLPKNIRVSCGWPSVGGLRKSKRTIGEAWSSVNSKDEHFEVFISPTKAEPLEVLSVLAHELVHVAVGLKCGHKGAFAIAARSIGLDGKMTATHAGDELAKKLKALGKRLGKYPHASLEGMTNNRKKQSVRMVKAHCTTCTYTIRASMKWLLLAVPTCPNPDCIHKGRVMEPELPTELADEPDA